MATKTKIAPHAKTTRPRALSWVGKKYRPGWCAYFQIIEIFGVQGVGDYDRDGDADAVDYWKAATAHGKVVKTSDPKKIPAGVMILWTGGSHGYGHAAYSLGGGEMVSTDLPTYGKIGRCSIDLPRSRWGHKLVGYVLIDGNGFSLLPTPPATKPKPPAKVTKYKVTTPAGLYGRTGPSTKHRVKGNGKGGLLVRPKNYVITAVRTVTGGGYTWAVTSKGTYYATKFTKKLE